MNREGSPDSAAGEVRDLMRQFILTSQHWTAQIAKSIATKFGTIWINPQLPLVANANCWDEATLQDGISPAIAFREIELIFNSHGLRCGNCTLNPCVSLGQASPLAEHLITLGWEARPTDVMYSNSATTDCGLVEGLQIIPARDHLDHARRLAMEAASGVEAHAQSQLADAAMLRLNDPLWDCRIAIENGRAIARVGVLLIGDVARIASLYVSQNCRNKGVGTAMTEHAIGICSRSHIRNLFLEVDRNNTAAISIYRDFGFKPIGQIQRFWRPIGDRSPAIGPKSP